MSETDEDTQDSHTRGKKRRRKKKTPDETSAPERLDQADIEATQKALEYVRILTQDVEKNQFELLNHPDLQFFFDFIVRCTRSEEFNKLALQTNAPETITPNANVTNTAASDSQSTISLSKSFVKDLYEGKHDLMSTLAPEDSRCIAITGVEETMVRDPIGGKTGIFIVKFLFYDGSNYKSHGYFASKILQTHHCKDIQPGTVIRVTRYHAVHCTVSHNNETSELQAPEGVVEVMRSGLYVLDFGVVSRDFYRETPELLTYPYKPLPVSVPEVIVDGQLDEENQPLPGEMVNNVLEHFQAPILCSGDRCSVHGLVMPKCITKLYPLDEVSMEEIRRSCVFGITELDDMAPSTKRNLLYWHYATSYYQTFGMGNRIKLPYCLVTKIREKFPNKKNTPYIGHKDA